MARESMNQAGSQSLVEISSSLTPADRRTELHLSDGENSELIGSAFREPQELVGPRLTNIELDQSTGLQVVEGQELAPFAQNGGGKRFTANFRGMKFRFQFLRSSEYSPYFRQGPIQANRCYRERRRLRIGHLARQHEPLLNCVSQHSVPRLRVIRPRRAGCRKHCVSKPFQRYKIVARPGLSLI